MDTLVDEKSLTTSAPQSRRYELYHSGFLWSDANLRRMYRLSLRGSFVEATLATQNLHVASKEGISLVEDSIEKRGLIPTEPDAPPVLTPPAPASTQTSLGSECSPLTLSMVGSGSYLQNENELREA